MQRVLRTHVKGKVVHDLGAGNTAPVSSRLLTWGASKVVAVDEEDPIRRWRSPRIRYVQRRFSDYAPKRIAVAFASWPINQPSGIHQLFEIAPVVIYLGKNTDLTVCGYPEMWKTLRYREVLDHVPHRRNTLIVYGHERVRRKRLAEEIAGCDKKRPWDFRELHAHYDRGGPAEVARHRRDPNPLTEAYDPFRLFLTSFFG